LDGVEAWPSGELGEDPLDHQGAPGSSTSLCARLPSAALAGRAVVVGCVPIDLTGTVIGAHSRDALPGGGAAQPPDQPLPLNRCSSTATTHRPTTSSCRIASCLQPRSHSGIHRADNLLAVGGEGDVLGVVLQVDRELVHA
jgi:hypothetical protein